MIRTTSRKATIALALAMSATLGLSACASGGGDNGGGGGGGNAAPSAGTDVDNAKLVSNNPQERNTLEQGGTFTIALGDWTTNFNSFHVDGNGSEYHQVTNATDPWLYNWSPDGTMKARTEFLQDMPKVEQKNGKQVATFELNPKAKWNDGTPIDYTAFEATWKSQAAAVDKGKYNNVTTAGYEDIESVAKGSSPSQVVITFKKPFNPVTEIFQQLLHPKMAATPEAFNNLMKTDFHPELRSGPYTLDSVNQSTKVIILKPNPNWWGNKPLLDKVVYRQMEDSADIQAFKNGEIDSMGVGGVANKARFAQIQGATGLDIRRSQRTATNVYVFNSKDPSLADVNVRKAIWQGINRDEWKKVRYSGLDYTEKPVNSALYFSFQPEAEDNMPVQFSVADAKKTLEGAGYAMGSDGYYAKGGKPAAVKYTYFGDDPLQTALAQLTQNQMKAIGVNLTLDNRPAASFGATMEKRDFGFVAMAWSSSSSSPLTSVCQTMCSDSGSNYSGLGTPALDAQMKKLGEISDAGEQAKAMNKVEKAWLGETYGQMPIANGPVMLPVRKGIANYGPALFASMHPQWENIGWQKGSTHK